MCQIGRTCAPRKGKTLRQPLTAGRLEHVDFLAFSSSLLLRCPVSHEELVPLAKPEEKQSTAAKVRGAASQGCGGSLPPPKPSPSLHPERERPARAAVWPCTHRAPGLQAACAFCQNARPEMPTGTVLCHRSLRLPWTCPHGLSAPAVRHAWLQGRLWNDPAFSGSIYVVLCDCPPRWGQGG